MNKFLRVLFYPCHLRHVWSDYPPAVLPNLYGKSFGVWCFRWMAEGDWYLECGGSGHPPCR